MGLRIATSTLYNDQTNNVTNATAQLQKYANELSTGVSLNLPSDNPTAISQVLQLTSNINTQNSMSSNAQLASNQLTTVDSSLSSLTDILQLARTLAVQGANGLLSTNDRKSIANQVDQLFHEAVSIANTQYNGSYIFSGTASTPNGPVTITGSPATGVSIFGNSQIVSEEFGSGNVLPLSTSLQNAFNVNAADGTPDIFSALLNLRDALNAKNITVESNGPITAPGSVITAATGISSAAFSKTLSADSSGKYSINLAGSGGTQTLTFTSASTIANIVSAINGSGTGVTASYNLRSAKISLGSTGTFNITDVPSAGATNSANLVEALALPSQGNTATDISGQIGEVDNVLNVALNARSIIGSTIQTLSSVQSAAAVSSTNEIATKSSLTDTNIAEVTSKFTLMQTALQASYMVTSRIEGHMLFDYL